MTHTFDIRFERSAGLGALLAPPENSFRWKGAGKLRIERDGISFAVKRGLLALFPLTRRVSAGQLKDVYREGDALHMTFTTAGSPQARVSCWAADASTAASDPQLLHRCALATALQLSAAGLNAKHIVVPGASTAAASSPDAGSAQRVRYELTIDPIADSASEAQ